MDKLDNQIASYLKRLFPLTRSLTGDGNRESLKILKEIIPLNIVEYPSGEKVFDWMIPQEWIIKDAWIKNSEGRKLVDFHKSNIHVSGYSKPIHRKMQLKEFKNHLYFIKDIPEAIPYRTSYYKDNWGFCVSFNDFKQHFNDDDTYEVFIDTEFKNGFMTIGEMLLKGRSKKEHLISTYICHPSLANDNLSGMILTALLARKLMKMDLNFSYRILFVPETIGAIAYCAKNQSIMRNIDSGFVVTTVGGPGEFGYKQSCDANHPINVMVEDVFKESSIKFKTYPFSPFGSDERQYSSQGFRINTVTITKDKYYEYEYYHTSLDNLEYIKAENILGSLQIYEKVLRKIDTNIIFKNVKPNCEVMLSKYGLYPECGGGLKFNEGIKNELAVALWLLFYCDGENSLFDISKKLDVTLETLHSVAKKLEAKNLLERAL